MNSLIKSIYYLLRPYIPLDVRWYLQKKNASFINVLRSNPPWPIPCSNLSKINAFWPNGYGSAFLLTHDVETSFGFSNIIEVSEIETTLGFKSSWNIVPNLYNINQSVINYLRDNSMEIGVHDWNHDGLLFTDHEIFSQRIQLINQVVQEWHAKGFRAGMAFHNKDWMQALLCDYDSSYYDTDPFQPMSGGCAAIQPFMLGKLVELPYTMPQDHVLFIAEATLKIPDSIESYESDTRTILNWINKFINKHDTEMPCAIKTKYLSGIEIWKMKAHWLCENNGLVLMITHPDYLCHRSLFSSNLKSGGENYCAKLGWLGTDDHDIQAVRDCGIIKEKWHGSLLEQYAAFLNWFKREFQGQYWHCLPMDMSSWYRGNH
jgi:hypothetical protein